MSQQLIYYIVVILCIAVEIRGSERDYLDRVINHLADGPGHTLTAFHSSQLEDMHTKQKRTYEFRDGKNKYKLNSLFLFLKIPEDLAFALNKNSYRC